MDLLHLILVFVVIGLALYLVNRFIPMDPAVKTVMNVAIIIILVIWLLELFLPGIATVPIGARRGP
jgi:hypothetical protein